MHPASARFPPSAPTRRHSVSLVTTTLRIAVANASWQKVELMHLYCNVSDRLQSLECLLRTTRRSQRPATQPSLPAHAAKKMTYAEQQRLIAAHTGGQSVGELARDFGVHRHTVAFQLERAGAKRHSLTMTPEQIDEAVPLYKDGVSLSKVKSQLGFAASTIRDALRSRDVRIRDTQGRRA
jgi:transposase-like protein